MNSLIIAETTIRQDPDGRYCLNDLHRAAGGEKRHQPSDWLRLQQTQELSAEISIPGNPGILTKQGFGTFVCKELVYAYAMWISPAFHLKVIRAYGAMVAPPSPILDPMKLLSDPMAMRGLLLSYTEKVLALEAEKAAIQLKAEAFDRLASADGSQCLTDAAKTLQLRRKALIDWLSANRWIYRRVGNSHWNAYQDRIQAGLLLHKVTTIPREDGTEKITEQVRVTPKGLAKLSAAIPRQPRRVA